MILPDLPHRCILQLSSHPPIFPFLHLLHQIAGHLLYHVLQIQVLGQKPSDLGVLPVAEQRARLFGIAGVDVDIDGGVTMRGPANLRAAGDDVGEDVGGGPGVGGDVGEAVDFRGGGVVDPKTRGEEMGADVGFEVSV